MVCKGIRHDENVQKTSDSNSFYEQRIYHDMATLCVGRWGRRKQANPKRTNTIDDVPLEADLHDAERTPADQSTPRSSCRHDDETRDMTPDKPEADTAAVGEGACAKAEGVAADTEMAPLSKESAITEIGDAASASPSPHTPHPEDVTANGYHDNREPVSMETEEEKIQELMGRSDTAVIFPEPVSDHEEANNITENEVDLDEDLAKCPHCEQAFPQLDLLKEHWHAAHPTQRTKHCCPQCAISFLSKGHLDKHIALHSPSAQICKICRKTFANVYRLQRHMISHDEGSELRKFKCTECQKAFKFKHHLKEHVRIHSGEKPFECQNCGKRFSHSGSYSSHMTSKKCWIVNMKMRGSAPGGRPDKPDGAGPAALVPKPLDKGIEVSLASLMYGSSLIGQQYMPYEAAAGQYQPSYLSQMNGAQNAFLSPMPPLAPTMAGAILPGMAGVAAFGCLPPGCATGEAKVGGSAPPESAALAKGRDGRPPGGDAIDENMNRKEEERDGPTAAGGGGERTAAVKSEPPAEDGDDDAAPPGEIRTAAGGGGSRAKDADVKTSAASDKADDDADDKSHTLTALASAATQQLQQLMKESKCDDDDDGKVDVKVDVKVEPEKDEQAGQSSQTCRFCEASFSSPIGLHQHERYLCKQNEEIRMKDGAGSVTPNGALCSPAPSNSHDEAADECSESERKIRVRSMITDEQVQILKSFYQGNQRPNKFELETLAQQIGFPKRVVQVWFQNMRARDRRKGRTIRDGKPSGSCEPSLAGASPAGYIPIVPQVSMPAIITNYYASAIQKPSVHGTSAYGSSASPQRACEASFEAEQPLDLTVKVPEAHTSKPFSSRPDPIESDEVLNLSVKSLDHPKKESSPTPATVAESALQKSTEEGGIVEGSTTHAASVPLVIPVVTSTIQSPGLVSVPIQINTTPAHTKSYASVTSAGHPPIAFNQPPAHAHHHDAVQYVYDAGVPSMTSSPNVIAADVMSPRSCCLENSYKCALSADANPDTSVATYALSQKTKRPRKKSWRQVGGAVEAEEMPDLDESVDEDGDSPLRKKRRSWKQHRVDVAEGLYACDQCDKMFSKQSSLARHKYEHSGQRPFPCDICTKAFKHKHHLTEHKRLHSGEKPFQCQKCGKRFSHSGSYSQHMNHRYKYCKPLLGDDCENGDMDPETEQSEPSP